MNGGLFHANVFLPKRVRGVLPTGRKVLHYTNHAIKAANTDRYGHIPLPASLDLSNPDNKIVEVEYYPETKGLVKVVIRRPAREGLDMTLVLYPTNNKRSFNVGTVWLNEDGDNHQTLNTRRYVQHPKRR